MAGSPKALIPVYGRKGQLVIRELVVSGVTVEDVSKDRQAGTRGMPWFKQRRGNQALGSCMGFETHTVV